MPKDVLNLFQPSVSRWFRETFAEPTPAQVLGWPAIAAGENTLILSPTGSGKTLAAFLYAIDSVIRVRKASSEEVEGVYTLYLSPLKALANDIERNVKAPLLGIQACAEQLGDPIPEIRVGIRTGDTSANERQKMIRTPPPHAHYDTGVAQSAVDIAQGQRHATDGSLCDCRRNPCAVSEQAGNLSCALVGATGRADIAIACAHWIVCDPTSAR